MKRLLFLPLLLAVAGCGVTSATHSPPAAAPLSATRTVSVPKPKAYVPDRAIAARSGKIDDGDIRLAITHLERAGATVALSVTLKAETIYLPRIGHELDDGETQPIRGSDSRENGASVDGVYLLDRAHSQKYLVARDADGRCICDAGIGHTRISDEEITLSATFGAPPPDVTAVDVVVPHFGTFANVPLG